VLLDLGPAAKVQRDLWTEPDNPRAVALMKVMDERNADFGRDTLAYGAAGRSKTWKLRGDVMSSRYTHELGRAVVGEVRATRGGGRLVLYGSIRTTFSLPFTGL
jgi:Domain of unknown function (DUF4113)